MRKMVTRLVLGLTLAGLIALGVMRHNRSEAEREREVERQQDQALAKALAKAAAHRREIGQSVVRMASTHDAVTD